MPGQDALAKQLGAPPPPGLVASLAAEDLDRLASCVRDARRCSSAKRVRTGSN